MNLLFVAWAFVGAGVVLWLWHASRSAWVGAIALVTCALSVLLTVAVGLAFNPEIGGALQQISAATVRHKIWLSVGVGLGGFIAVALNAGTALIDRAKTNKVFK
ncbi:MAG: hypothetical protein Q7J29_05310 [Stagnimonas sp.]|nr:hypothetical protein [Stagnimonas sp.]